MEDYFPILGTHNFRSNCSYSGNTCIPFFIESPKKREERKTAHHNSIINVYQHWYETIPNFVQLRAIDIPNSRIAYIENLKLNVSNDGNSKGLRTAEEMALSHLKDKQYKQTYDKYLEVFDFQKDHNKKIESYVDSTILSLKTKLDEHDDKKIYDLFKYYLVKIDDIVEWIDNHEAVQYRLNHLEPISDLNGNIFSNPFPEKINIVREDLFSRYQTIIGSINEFNYNLTKFIERTTEFRNSLKPIIDNGVLGIKGKCFIEEQLSLKGRIKSRLHLSN